MSRPFAELELRIGDAIGVGFSGGPDSLALAAALAQWRRISRFRVTLIHVNHGIRPESATDAERARELAARLELPIIVRALEPDIVKRTGRIGIEEAARRERYLAFADVCREIGAQVIALAHHQHDQAETVLLHLMRGAGVGGAAAMSASTRVEIPWWTNGEKTELVVWRPLLNQSRAEIDAFVELLGLQPVLDPSNFDQRLLRNWLRHDLIPSMESRRPGAPAALARFARIAAEEDSALDALAEAAFREDLQHDGSLDCAGLSARPLALRRRVIRLWLTRAMPNREFSFERVEAVREFAAYRGNPGRLLQLGGDEIVVWNGDSLLAGPRNIIMHRLHDGFAGPLAPAGFVSARLESDAVFAVDGWRIAGYGPGSVELRKTRAGDRFARDGQPVREWARAQGIHPLLRKRLLVADAGERPVWAAGPNSPTTPGWSFELKKLESEESE